MRQRQRRKSSTDSHIELSVAENFWDVVRICHFRILQLIGHSAPQTDTTLVKAEKPKEACSEMVNSA
jgi:flagellar motor switch protein FliG